MAEISTSAAAAPTETNEPRDDSRIEFHPTTQSSSSLVPVPVPILSNGCSNLPLQTLNPNSITPNNAFSSMLQKAENGDLTEFDPELSFRITFRKIGAGLENLGNTCFLNSVLQCLTYTEPFAAYLQSGKHKTSCRVAGFCAMCAIQNHVRNALQSTGRILAPKYLVKNIRCISQNFHNARQEDAHEYMVSLLESIHKCCLPTGLPSESPSAYEKSLVHKIFGGLLRSQVKCSECSYGSKKFDPFLDLSLEIAKADSLLKALEHFTAVEELDGGEKQYQCQQCNKKVMAVRQLTIHKAPYVLTIHLKRFGSTIIGQKIDKIVHFGPTLDLKPFVSGTYEGDLNYTLYGVLVHAGWSSHSGHYYCFVRTSSGMWYALDDNEVFRVKERTVLEQKAYMLFYVRDRRNPTLGRQADLAPKRPADFVQNESSAENHVENKKYSATLLGCRETIQNDMLTITSSTPSVPMLTNVVPVTSASIQKSLLKNSYFFKHKGTLMDGSAVSTDSVESSLRMTNLVQQSTHIHVKEESLSRTDPSAIGDCGNISHPCTEPNDSKAELLEHEEAKPTAQIVDECFPENAYSVVNDGALHPNGLKPGVITEPKENMHGTATTLPDCVSKELDSRPSTKDIEHKTQTADVNDMLTSKVSCENKPQADVEGCVDVAGMKTMDEQEEATATSNHFTAEVPTQISDLVFPKGQIDSHPTDALSNAIKDPEKSIVTACNVLQEVYSKAFAKVENHENAFTNEAVLSKAPSESLPEMTSDVKGCETSAGSKNEVINELEQSKSADHCIESEDATQIGSSFVKIGDCISQHTGATINTINEHEKTTKCIAATVDALSQCNVLQEYTSKTSATGMEHKNVSFNELAMDMAVCKVGEVESEVGSSVQLVSETCAEEILCKVGCLGSVKVPSQLTIEENSCKGAVDVKLEEISSVVFSNESGTEQMPCEGKLPSQLTIEENSCKDVVDVKLEEISSVVFSNESGTEKMLCEGVNDIEPGEVKLTHLSNQLGTEVLCKQVNGLEPGEVMTQSSSPSGTEGTTCIRVHGFGPEEIDSTRLSNQVGSAVGCWRIMDIQPGDVGLMPLASQQGAEGGKNSDSLNETESSVLYTAEETGPKSTSRCVQKEALDKRHCRNMLKPKKGPIKFQASSLNTRSSLLLRASLRIYRKKHKRSRKHSLKYDKSTQKGFREKSVSGLEPSTSEDTQRIPFDFSQRLQGNSGVDKKRRQRKLKHDKSSEKNLVDNSIMAMEPSTSEYTNKIPFDSSRSHMRQGNSIVNKSRCKCRLEHDKSTQKVSGEESISGLEQSTFEETMTVAFDSAQIHRKKLGNSSAIKRHSRELAKDVVDSHAESSVKRLQTELKERIDYTGAIPANKEAVKTSSLTLTTNGCESNGSHGLQNLRSSVNDFMSMLTRGLEETTVARWSNVGGSQCSETIGSSSRTSISVGCVPDEWDVEYDRGKRKKVKSKNSDLGEKPLNPFQESVTARNRLKKFKLDQSSSGSIPFRI